MFFTFKCNKRLIVVTVIAVAVVAILCVLDALLSKPAGTPEPTESEITLLADTDTSRAAFLKQFGWEINTKPLEVEEVLIPEQFDQVYQNYNDLQKSQGFDLTDYCGKRVKRWTYAVTNYPDGIEDVRANLLVYDNKVIGGDICTLPPDGFMHGFNLQGTGITHLPSSSSSGSTSSSASMSSMSTSSVSSASSSSAASSAGK